MTAAASPNAEAWDRLDVAFGQARKALNEQEARRMLAAWQGCEPEPAPTVPLRPYVPHPGDHPHTDLARRAQAGDRDATEQLLTAFQCLIKKIAGFYARGNSDKMDDYQQAGRLGVIETIKRFDPDRGFRFNTYANHWVHHFVQDANAKDSLIPVGRSRIERGCPGIPVVSLRKDKGVSRVFDDDHDDDPYPDPSTVGWEDRAIMRLTLLELSEEDQELIRLRYYEGKDLRDIAPLYGVTHQAIYMRIQKTLARLKAQWGDAP